MHVFMRSATVERTKMLESIGYALEIAQKVSTVTGLEVGVWQTLYGAPLNTVSWTTVVDSHAVVVDAGEKLMADPGYVDMITANSGLFASAPEDSLSEVLVTANESDAEANFAAVTTARCGPGKVAEAMAWGADMHQYAAGIVDLPGMFCRSIYGEWGSMAWISLATTIDQVDAATAALSADPGYIERIDAAEGLFEAGSGHSYLSRRLT